jgi:hypothetical protein
MPALQSVRMAGCGYLVADDVMDQCRPEEEELQLLKRFVRPKLEVEFD